jgi:hypothetical protein
MILNYLLNKILLYNIHPVAELLKPIIDSCNYEKTQFLFYDYDIPFYEVFFDYVLSKKYCWKCHKNIETGINASEKFFCEYCWINIYPNDDIVNYSSLELLFFKVKY